MVHKLKSLLLTLVFGLSFGAPALVPAVASAVCQGGNVIQTGVGTGIDQATGAAEGSACAASTDNGTGTLQAVARKAVNLFSVLVGIVAVIFVIYGGFRYITSGGDSSNVGNAKNTLIYAIVGLVIVALAQLIVRYVLSAASDASGGGGGAVPSGAVMLFHF